MNVKTKVSIAIVVSVIGFLVFIGLGLIIASDPSAAFPPASTAFG